MKARALQRTPTFWGSVWVPAGTSEKYAEALGYVAWKGGIHEDMCTAKFAKWFRKFATKHPTLACVYVFDLYPVDEFRWLGQYETSSAP